ncbi:phospholipase D-like domain-containing protein [Hymenobacter sp. BT175]|uniref:phospholipase D-like domain-containing protein n=1 Tax=Hymenobacter translucens TaxID=2886507 RepID=UPI001D0ECA9B|nr:phospholipase D-like domain-containing protein [Hymenobacter translucens]MCC2548458.1 phospholipase D-like domain-containing protein [Hymenobacter translucens]
MPQFLTTSGTSHFIEEIIKKAKKELVLITPYLKLSRILSERLAEANQRGVHVKLVYGKSELKPSEKKQLDTFSNLSLLYLENLHAKCYYNESTLIVSSMNLYEFSEKNNREMGIVLTRREDSTCFADALAEAQSIIAAARVVSEPKSAGEPTKGPTAAAAKEFDYALKSRLVYELLKKLTSNPDQFTYETVAHAFGGGSSSTINAPDFPRKGIHFKYDGAIRFDFAKSYEYQSFKKSKQESIDRLLADYRCYWNRDVLQIYAAKSFDYTDEAVVAAYQLQAIEKVLPHL